MSTKTIISWVNGAAQSISVPDVAYIAPAFTIEDKVSALITTVTLSADSWEGSVSPYSQSVTIDGITKNSIIDLQPTPEQLTVWQDDGFAFTTSNDNGTVTIYVSGGVPTEDITVQVKIQEVVVV